MDMFYTVCKQLTGFAFIYLICTSLVNNEKFKKYCCFFIGICMLLTVISPINKLSDIKLDFSWSFTDTDNVNVSVFSTEEGIKYYAISVLKNSYGNYSFTVRSHKTDGGNIMLYIICNTAVPQNMYENIYATLNEKIGIYCENVNIYLSNNNSGE